ncbi:FAD-binding-3 domain-containing protein [Fusarium sp. LHS14.1]|nr:FAD-binding-3 domain-containing protein [Fusarium sp. LHS14.1]
MAITSDRTQVLIVGAGPAGQLLGLMLAKQGISVTIVEQAEKLDDRPRATHYGPPAMKILNSAGVGDEVRSKGFIVDTVAWRGLDGSYIAGISHETQKDSADRMVALPLSQLAEVLYEYAKALPKIKYLFNRKVVDIGQDESKAWVDTVNQVNDKQSRLEADFVVGCDGANSIVRRSLFGDWKFPGRTWDEQIVATNVYYDFEKFGFCDSNFIIDPEHWYMAAKITKDGMWRVTYGETSGLSHDELKERQPEKFQTMLPGHPDPSQYKLASISPYKVHQRLAEKLRVGRFILAADAAHLCNPFGGLGLTGGIVDVAGVYECLVGIYTDRADQSILDIYSDIRRKKYQEIVDPISSSNLRRMFSVHPDKVLETDEFLQMCKKAANDPILASELLQSAHLLNYDFTQHYTR